MLIALQEVTVIERGTSAILRVKGADYCTHATALAVRIFLWALDHVTWNRQQTMTRKGCKKPDRTAVSWARNRQIDDVFGYRKRGETNV